MFVSHLLSRSMASANKTIDFGYGIDLNCSAIVMVGYCREL